MSFAMALDGQLSSVGDTRPTVPVNNPFGLSSLNLHTHTSVNS
jgi:hypothetical protein